MKVRIQGGRVDRELNRRDRRAGIFAMSEAFRYCLESFRLGTGDGFDVIAGEVFCYTCEIAED